MTRVIDYALMAGVSYRSTRDPQNRFPIPFGWNEITEFYVSLPSGFEATTFAKGNQAVISFAGTGPGVTDWTHGNLPLALGILSDQLREAADYYLQVKASLPAGTNITFTGHSLGGGLAALMAVFFAESAFTYDQAPFRNSALAFATTEEGGFATIHSVAQDLRAYLADGAPAGLLAPLDAYIAAADPTNLNANSSDTFASREARVTDINTQGEILSYLPFSRIGSQTDVPQQNNVGTPIEAQINLHSQALLAAFLQSEQTAAPHRALNDVTFKLHDLVKMIFDGNLFSYPTGVANTTNPNFLELIVNHEAGCDPRANASITPDAMVTRFTQDLWKVAQDGGLTLNNSRLADALTAFAMQKYYYESQASAGYNKTLFTGITGGIEFDMRDVASSVTAAKGFPDFRNFLEQYYTTTDSGGNPVSSASKNEIVSALSSLRDWYIQAGADALNATDTRNRNAFMFGDVGSDILTGGTGNDLLVGNAGIDTLTGGIGNDVLIGGTGNDILIGGDGEDSYVINAGDGNDRIIDSGHSILKRDGKVFAGVFVQDGSSNTYKFVADNSVTISINSPATLDFGSGDSITFQDLTTVDLVNQDLAGVRLVEAGAQPPTTTLTITGDIYPTDINPSVPGIQATADAQGNPIGTPQPYADILLGSAGNDHIVSGELNDDVSSGAGDDWIEGGSGNDYIYGDTGKDLIEGGAGADILLGGDDNDRLFGNVNVDIATAITSGNSDTDSGQKGDWISGNAGDDTLITGADNEVLAGGAGNDLLIAGAGEDFILGDSDYVVQFFPADNPSYSIGSTDWYHSSPDTFNWTVTDPDGTWIFSPVVGETNPAASGADTIYAGEGNDHAWGGDGDDVLYGEGGNDELIGEAGNDILLGGAGDDTLTGDASYIDVSLHGNDYLDGGDGNDTLWGGGGDDSLFGGVGDDKLYGETGANYLDGEDGDDILNSGGPSSELLGGAGDDNISAAGGGNYLDGEDGSDTLAADGGNNTLFGGAGDDALSAADGNNYLDGEEGNNTVIADGGGNTLFAGTGNDTLSSGGGNSYLDGGDGTNTLIADGGGNTLFGGSGDDTLSSTGGNSYLDGGDGSNTLIADGGGNTLFSGSGNDTLSSAGGNSYLDAGDGNDTLVVDGGGNTLFGGAGDDLLQAADGNDSLAGDDGNDELQGGGGDDRLDGGDGNDVLFGENGNDNLLGGAGEDYLEGGVGADYLAGGDGYDLYYYAPGDGVDTIVDAGSNALSLAYFYSPFLFKLGLGSLMLDFGNGDVIHVDGFDPDNPLTTSSITEFRFDGGTVLTLDEVLAQGFDFEGTPDADVLEGTALDDRINAFAGDDVVVAKAGNDTVDAGDGADVVHGGAGDDDLDGGAGDDQLFGDEGDDRLYGGAGTDTLVGGTGDDTYLIDDTLDTIVENTDEGYDVIESSISYTIADNVEELDLTGSEDLTGTGNAADNYIAGNEGNNFLYGLDGDDGLEGGEGDDVLDGGTGGDFMFGDVGDDLYIVDSEDDVVLEEADLYHREVTYDEFGDVTGYGYLETSGGYDTVESSVSFTLDLWTESLVLTGSDAVDGTGNVEANSLEGNDADNALYANRLNGQADDYPSIGIFLQQFSNPRNAAEEVLQDKANAAIYRAEFPWFIPQQVDLHAGAGDTLIGNGGDDRLYGGLDDDALYGGDGNDLLYGFAGADYMAGGAGDDSYVVSGAYDLRFNYVGGEYVRYYDDSEDSLYEAAGEGIDTVYSEVDFALPENFENLTLIFDTRDYDPDGAVSTLRVGREIATFAEGNALDNVITANDAGNELYGDEGNDTLIGGAGSDYLEGDEGADTMIGGAGDDEYDVDDMGDVVIEEAGRGHDDVYAEIDYTLAANVEDLYLGGDTYTENLRGTGNELDNLIVGNDGDNVLMGLAGDDVLDGGFGDDLMDGGAGDDAYYVDSEFDVTTENAGEGYDSVYTSVTHTLGAEIEALYLQDYDSWGDPVGAIDGTGNELDNLIVGNESDNVLDGLDGNDTLDGGGGDDLMLGGTGDDTYYVDSEYDEVIEADGEGLDTVYESLDYYDIPDAVENTTVIGDFADPDVFDDIYRTWYVWGNELDNRILGNDGSNDLSGNDGNDTIDGRAGWDSISGDAGDDVLYGGDDAVAADPYGEEGDSQQYLAANSDWIDGGDGNDTIDGGSGDDSLYGDDGNDVIYGGDDGLIADDLLNYGEIGQDNHDTTADGRVFLTNDDYLDGGAGDDVLDGGSGNDYLDGGDGNDTLYGGADGPLNTSNDDVLDGGAGIDMMAGGTGDDQYYVDGFYTETTDIPVYDDCGDLVPGAVTRVWTTDTVIEYADQGYDTVYSSADYTLPDNVEDLYLEPNSDALIGRGNAGDNQIYGNYADNRLEGGAGDDTLDGGAGNDVLDGGSGNDILVGGAGDDVYNLGFGSGRDDVDDGGGGFDVVHVLNDLTAVDLTLARVGDDVQIGIDGTLDRMTLDGWFSSGNPVQEIDFCDGSFLDAAAIADLANAHVLDLQDDYASVQEDGVLLAAGNVLDNDSDSASGTLLAVTNPGSYAGDYGTLELAADGSYAYTLDNAAAQWLAEGESASDFFAYQAEDADQAGGSATLVVDITGQNDAPSIDAGAGSVTEGEPGSDTVEADAVFNGSFESGTAGWNLQATAGFYFTYAFAQEGNSALLGYGLSNGVISQDVPTEAWRDYGLDFWFTDFGYQTSFDVRWNGATVATISNGYFPDYTRFHYDVTGADGLSQLEFDVPTANYFVLDGVSATTTTELARTENASGTVAFFDVDLSDAHTVSFSPQAAGYLGVFNAGIEQDSSGSGAGTIAWDFSVEDDVIQYLAEGETLTQYYDVTVDDGHPDGAATQAVAVSIVGVNDAPEIEFGDDSGSVAPDAPSAQGTIGFSDVDLVDTHGVTVAAQDAGYLGSFAAEIAADSTGSGAGSVSWSFSVGAAEIAALAGGETLEQDYDVTVSDGHEGGSATQSVAITLTGVNDAPLAADDAADVQEDGALVATGNLLANDADPDASDTLSVSNPGTYAGAWGALALEDDGTYSYALDNDAVQFLAEGQQLQDVFAYEVSDGIGSTGGMLTVTIDGANDAPLAEDLAASVDEDGPAVTFVPVYSDVDTQDTHSVSAGAFANSGFELGSFAGWVLSDAALGEVVAGGAPLGNDYASLRAGAAQDAYTTLARSFTLAAGETLSGLADFVAGDALPYDDDGYVSIRALGGAATQLFGASVTSVGDYGDSGWVAFEFVAPGAGTYVLEAGVRNGQDNAVDSRLLLDGVEQSRAAPGVTLNADGTFAYDPSERFQWLAEGETATDAIGYIVADDHGAQAAASATVQIVGENDAPEIGAAATEGGVTEDNGLPAAAALGADGSLAFIDVDLSDVHEVQLGTLDSGYLGDFSAQLLADTAGGGEGSVQWTFSVTNGELDALGQDDTRAQTYEVLIDDGHGGIDERFVTVTLNGANDAPVTEDDAASVQEDGALVASGNVLANDSDIDGNTTLTVANAGLYGSLDLSANGEFTYTLDNGSLAVQSLAADQVVQDAFAYLASDGIATTPGSLVVSITGSNDAPLLVSPIADQDAAAGTAFSFTFAPDTFSDIDLGDTLAYAASVADGTALPSWLAFDAATRTFSGTPPGGTGGEGGGTGTGTDCGCDGGGASAPETLLLRVTATDTSGASASDDFTLDIAGGSSGGGSAIVPIVGTDHDDVLAGTAGNDVIDGRGGYDKMSGGAGDDTYFVDQTGSKVDKVVENAVAGYDTVYSSADFTLPSNVEELHLIGNRDLEGHGNALANMLIGSSGDNWLYGEAGNDLLLDDAGNDRLDGGSGDDVLDGGAGNDTLTGGTGNDLFVHAAGGGDDDVVQESGGTDALRFGAGIAAGDVTALRSSNDLLLRLANGNGSVTLKDWFASSSKRVEQVQFADGTSWDEAAIRARVTTDGGGSGGGQGGYSGGCGPDGGSGGGYDGGYNGGEHDDGHGGDDHGHDGSGGDPTHDAIAARLGTDPNYDFTALAAYLQRQDGGGYGAMTPQQIAQRWLQVQNCVASLAQSDHDHDGGHDGGGYGGGGGCGGGDDDRYRYGWGYGGSTGQSNGCGGMGTFSGLCEGLQKL